LFNWRDWTHPAAGGAEKATYEIARRLIKYGVRPHLLVGAYPGCEAEAEWEGIRISRLGGRYGVYFRSAIRYLLKLRGHYDVIVDEINTVPFFTPLYAEEPVVAFIHQLAADVLFEELPWPQAALWASLEPSILRLYSHSMIVTSRSTAKDLVGLGIPEGNLRTIDYGVDREVYRPGRKSALPSILYIGRLKRFKGVHFLIEAMRQVLKQEPEARLTIIGTGDRYYLAELRSLVDSISKRSISLLHYGFAENLGEKVRALQEAWVLVVPSIREGFGLTVAEANACGTPAIVFDSPGLREVVVQGKTGLIVPQRDVVSLASGILRVLKDPALRSRLSQEALEWSKNFDWEASSRTMYGALREAVQP